MPTSSVGRTSSRGITLLEMIVVVAVIGLVAGISFPAISAGLDSVRMVSTTDSVAAFLNAAVTRAERRQQAVELVISPRENLLTLYTNDPGFVRELRLPNNIFVESVLPAVNEDPTADRHFLFMPGGAVPGMGVQLANRRNGHRIVRLDPMTGFPRVESVVSR